MGIAICPNLRFRVHPYCQTRGGGLLQLSREDRQALKDCKVKNNLVTKSQQSKPRTYDSKKKPEPKPGKLSDNSKSKKKRRRKESKRRKAKPKSRRKRKRRRRVRKKKVKQVS